MSICIKGNRRHKNAKEGMYLRLWGDLVEVTWEINIKDHNWKHWNYNDLFVKSCWKMRYRTPKTWQNTYIKNIKRCGQYSEENI